MKKTVLVLVKKAAEKVAVQSANSTTSFWHHQPKAPKSIEKLKK